MNAADFDKLSEEHFFQCSKCGQFVDKRELRDVIFHATNYNAKASYSKNHRQTNSETSFPQLGLCQNRFLDAGVTGKKSGESRQPPAAQ